MKFRSGSIDDSLNELQFSLARKRTQAARVTLREANRRYRELHQHYLRVLCAVDSGAFDQSRPRRITTARRSAANE